MAKAKEIADEEVLERLKEFFYKNYLPTGNPLDPGVMFMSTNDVYFAFYMLYPNRGYKAETMVKWLQEGGFKLIDLSGTMRLEWMIKPNPEGRISKHSF